MRKSFKLGIGVAAVLAANPVWAADHQDGTIAAGGALSDPTTDITDVFAWMSADTTAAAGNVYLAMNVAPGATASSVFSTTAKYVFHTSSSASFTATASVSRDVICTFTGASAPQTASCWVVDPSKKVSEYASGSAGTAANPLSSTDGKLKIFAGPRNDPFFFNLAAFKNVASTVLAAYKSYVGGDHATYITALDANGCPTLSTAAVAATTGQLATDCSQSTTLPPRDFFRKPTATPNPDNVDCVAASKPALVGTLQQNEGTSGTVLSLVLSVDKTLLTSGGSTLAVWGATTR